MCKLDTQVGTSRGPGKEDAEGNEVEVEREVREVDNEIYGVVGCQKAWGSKGA